MTTVKTKLDNRPAVDVPHRPTTDIPASNVAEALQYVFDNAGGGGGGGGAPTDAEYVVATGDAGLSNERVLTNTDTIEWDAGTLGQMKANLAHLGIEDLTDPGADRLMVWDESANATAFFDVEAPFEFSDGVFGFASGPLEDIWNATYANQDLLVWDGSNLVPLNKGSNYEFLRVNGSGNLEWQALPSGSGLGDMLSINDLSDVSSVANARTNLSVYSIAEVDALITAQDLDFAGDTGTGAIDLDSETMTFTGGTGIDTSVSGNAVTFAIDATVATLTGSQTLTNKGIDLGTNTLTGSVAEFDAALQSDTFVFTSEVGSVVQAWSAVLDATTASFTTADETKLDHITVTQAVDLDAIETRVNALDAAVVLAGTWDASSGSFPGSGTAQAGESYIVSVGGTVDSVEFTANDRIVAITDNASAATYASNWHKLDYTDAVLSVAGRTGAVTLAAGDIASGTFADARISESSVTQHQAAINHDALSGFVADEHIAHSGVTFTAGNGLTGGGTIAASRTFNVGAGTGISVAADSISTNDSEIVHDSLSGFVSDEHIAHSSVTLTAGNGLTGGGNITASRSFAVGAGTGIDVAADSVSVEANTRTATITFVIDGGGSAITTGVKGYLEVPFACTIQKVAMLADQSGSIVVDIWKDTYANYPPTDADTITASAVPTISAATKSVDSTLTGWTTSISADEVLGFNVDSVSTVQRVTISLEVLKT